MNFNLEQLTAGLGAGMPAGGANRGAVVSFKAGKMEIELETGKIKADRRKGLIRVTKDAQGMHQF
jgi:hypothetical protein